MKLSSRIAAASAALALVGASALIAGPVAAATPTPDPGAPTTWSVVPAGTRGADGRQAFAYNVKPGSLIQDEVAIANTGQVAETFRIYGTDAFTDRKTGAFSLLVASQKPTDVGSWISIPTREQVIQPNQELRIPFQISVPTDATPGDHSAGIIASVIVKTKGTDQANITVEERVAARVYLRVVGPLKAAVASVGQTSAYAPNLNPFAPGSSSVDYGVKNTGNVRVDVAQTIALTGPFGIPLASFSGQRIRNLLPGSTAQQSQRADVWPLLLVWTTVKLKTLAPTDTVTAADVRDLTGATVAVQAPPVSATSSADTIAAAIPIALLLIVVVLGALVWSVARYIRMSRERVWEAIEEAARLRDGHEGIDAQDAGAEQRIGAEDRGRVR